MAGRQDFNINSTKQLAGVLFDELNYLLSNKQNITIHRFVCIRNIKVTPNCQRIVKLSHVQKIVVNVY